MDVWQLIAERKIQEAMAEGAFSQLSGTGQPLHLDEDPFEDPSLRMAHRLLRNNGFAPEGRRVECADRGLQSEDSFGCVAQAADRSGTGNGKGR